MFAQPHAASSRGADPAGIDQLDAELIEIMHIAGGNAFGCRLIVSEMTFVSIRII